MLISFVYIFILGLMMAEICKRLHLPGLLGMLIAGMLLGPFALNVIDRSVLDISKEIRQFALIVILTRAGLSLDLKELKAVGRPAFLMCFIPACFEIIGVIILAPLLLNVTLLEAALMGSVLAAVSPAVIVPRMLKIMKEGYGVKKGIPQMILAGASVDDVFVIVLFTSFTSLLTSGGGIEVMDFVNIPISIILGMVVGIMSGLLLVYFFKRFHIRDTVKVLIVLSSSFLLLTFETLLEGSIGFSALIAIMCIGIAIHQKNKDLAKRLEIKYDKLWVGTEILLFVLVGAIIDISFILEVGLASLFVLLFAMLFRMIGVLLCMLKTNLNKKERTFCMVAYMPKATVQAAIGSIPLTLGLACGNKILAVAVLSILISAPLGAQLIDHMYKKLL